MAAGSILFDLDGTLWNSLPWYAAILSNGDVARSAKLLNRLRCGASIVTLADQQGLSKAQLVRQCTANVHTLELFPLVKETLRELSRQGMPMGVVTSLSGEVATAMLEGAGLIRFFAVMVHPGNCRSGKASGVPLGRALSQLQIEASKNVFYVGDREDDAAGARASGKCAVLHSFAEVLEL
jgi:phosphoglycolate phosphatase-like HAD superfamily hydrolase